MCLKKWNPGNPCCEVTYDTPCTIKSYPPSFSDTFDGTGLLAQPPWVEVGSGGVSSTLMDRQSGQLQGYIDKFGSTVGVQECYVLLNQPQSSQSKEMELEGKIVSLQDISGFTESVGVDETFVRGGIRIYRGNIGFSGRFQVDFYREISRNPDHDVYKIHFSNGATSGTHTIGSTTPSDGDVLKLLVTRDSASLGANLTIKAYVNDVLKLTNTDYTGFGTGYVCEYHYGFFHVTESGSTADDATSYFDNFSAAIGTDENPL